MRAEVYLNALFPVCQQKGTILIILTTPLGNDNATSRLFDTADDAGDCIIHCVRIGASCPACTASKILCVHEESATGEGLSRKKRARFMHFYKDNMHVAMREFSGEPGESGRFMFKNEWLINLANRKTEPLTNAPNFIMIGMDPANTGRNEWAMTACYFDHIKNIQVIIHMDACHPEDVSSTGIMMMLKKTFLAVRSKCLHFQAIPIIVACEAAPSVISEQIHIELRKLVDNNEVYNVFIMNELPGGAHGVPKTNTNTQEMITYTQILLECNQIAFSDHFTTCTPTASGNDEECIKFQFIRQMHNIQRKAKEHPNKKGELSFTINGKGSGQNDDLAVSFFMIVYWYLAIMGERKMRYDKIINTSIPTITIGGTLEVDDVTGENKFAADNHAERSYGFEHAQVDERTGKVLVPKKRSKYDEDFRRKRQRYNNQNPTRRFW